MTLSLEQFRERILATGLLSAEQLDRAVKSFGVPVNSVKELEQVLIQSGKLTKFQIESIARGKRLRLGVYILKDKIGAGGMGQVFLAEHSRMKRDVVLKVLPAEVVENEESVQRFHREVHAAAQLNHRNIVTAYDANEDNGTHFYVMEYIEGRDLATLVKEKGTLSVDLALQLLLQTAEGLKYAHDKGIIHRDIKPGNLLLDNTGTVKILDMGLARIEPADDADDGKGLTDSGIVMGTVDYMAPEQALDTRSADERSDIYSLGCTLFFLLTRLPLFAETTVMKKLMAHQNQQPPSLADRRRDVSAEVESLYQKMVAKQPEDRFQSMAEVVEAINKSLSLVAAESSDSHSSVSHSKMADSDLQSFLAGWSQETSPAMLSSVTVADSDPMNRKTVPAGEAGDTDKSSAPQPAIGADPIRRNEGSGSPTKSKRLAWTSGIVGIVLISMIAYFGGGDDHSGHTSGSPSGQQTGELNDSDGNDADLSNQTRELTISDSEVISRLLQKVHRLGGEVVAWDSSKAVHYPLALDTPTPKEADFGMTIRLNDVPSLNRPDLQEVFELCRVISRHHPLSLDLSRSRVTSEHLAAMVQLSFLTLNLDGNPEIDDRIANVLKTIKGLKILGLQETAVSDKTIEHLESLDSLEILNLTQTHVTAQSRLTIAEFPNLKRLILTGTDWDESSIQSLRSDLPQCEIIWNEDEPGDADGQTSP